MIIEVIGTFWYLWFLYDLPACHQEFHETGTIRRPYFWCSYCWSLEARETVLQSDVGTISNALNAAGPQPEDWAVLQVWFWIPWLVWHSVLSEYDVGRWVPCFECHRTVPCQPQEWEMLEEIFRMLSLKGRGLGEEASPPDKGLLILDKQNITWYVIGNVKIDEYLTNKIRVVLSHYL